MSAAQIAFIGTALGIVLGASWYLASALETNRASLAGRSVLLGEAIKRKMTRLLVQFREKVQALPPLNTRRATAKDIQDRDDLEVREWSKALDAEWPEILRMFRNLHLAQRASRKWCFYGSCSAYACVAVCTLTLLIMVGASFQPNWETWIAAALPYICLALGATTLFSIVSLYIVKSRDQRLQRALDEES